VATPNELPAHYQRNVDNLNNVSHETSGYFKIKKEVYLTATINAREINSKINNIKEFYRGISDFQIGYQPTNHTVKDESDDLLTDCNCSLASWSKHYFKLFNVYGFSYVRQWEMQTAEPVVTQPSALEADMSIKKVKDTNSLALIRLQQNILS
jgi:hypothetical protein